MDVNVEVFRVRSSMDDGYIVLWLEGQLDVLAAGRLKSSLEAGASPSLLDMSAVTFMDCAGYRALTGWCATSIGTAGVRLRGPRGQPSRLLTLLDELQLADPGIHITPGASEGPPAAR